MIDQTIQLKRNYQIKLPDAIIAATSITNKVPLISDDTGFSKIKELDLVLLELLIRTFLKRKISWILPRLIKF